VGYRTPWKSEAHDDSKEFDFITIWELLEHQVLDCLSQQAFQEENGFMKAKRQRHEGGYRLCGRGALQTTINGFVMRSGTDRGV
jgi:hypothetical protein